MASEVAGARTMDRQARVAQGEKLFVVCVFTVLVLEAVGTLVAVGLWFSWIRLLLGTVACGILLFLANWLYSGSRTARVATLAWAGVQVVVLAAALVTTALDADELGLFHHVGAPAAWLALIMLLGYAALAALLLGSASVRDFLADRAGQLLPEETVKVVDMGAPITWPQDQAQAISRLGTQMFWVAVILLAAGGLRAWAGVLYWYVYEDASASWRPIVEGVLLAALGVVLFGPAAAVRGVVQSASSGMGHLMNALTALANLYVVQLLLVLLLAAVAAVRLYLLLF
jgi:hypothetical protein